MTVLPLTLQDRRHQAVPVTKRRLGRWNLAPAVIILLAISVALLAIPPVTLPRSDLDSGWTFGIVAAIAQGKRFGRDIVFTYGPWAELDLVTPVRSLFLAIGLAGAVVTAFLLVGTAWALARAWLTARNAAVLTLVTLGAAVGAGTSFSGRVLLLTTLVLVGTATGALPQSWHRWLFPTLAVFSVAALETKFSNGTLAMASTMAAAFFASPATLKRRVLRVLISLGTAFVALVAFWVAAGQRLSDLPSWITSSIELTRGYSDAMATEYGPAGEYVLYGIAIVALGFTLLYRRSGWASFRIALVLVWIALMGLRLGFTRHDSGHVAQSFLLLLVAFMAARPYKHTWLPVIGAALCTALALGSAGSAQTYFSAIDPSRWGRNTATFITDLVSKDDRDESLDKAYTSIRAATRLPDEVLNALRGKTVAVDPWDINIALAYGLSWQPVPVIQTYSAYTPALDQANANALASPDAPQAILRKSSETIDYRNSIWESPAYMVAMLCHYRPVAQSGVWMVLHRSADRCGAPAVLFTETVNAGESVQVPEAPDDHSIVVASFDLPQSLGERLQESIFKPNDEEYLSVSADAKYRVPRAQLAGPFLMSIPAASGWTGIFAGWTPYPQIAAPQDGTVTFSVIELAT